MQKFKLITDEKNIFKNYDAVFNSFDNHNFKGVSWREAYEGEFRGEIRNTLKLSRYMAEKVECVINELVEIWEDFDEIQKHLTNDGTLYDKKIITDPITGKGILQTYSQKLLGFVDVEVDYFHSVEKPPYEINGFSIINAFGKITYQDSRIRGNEFLFIKF